jgi:hypothetical protein
LPCQCWNDFSVETINCISTATFKAKLKTELCNAVYGLM